MVTKKTTTAAVPKKAAAAKKRSTAKKRPAAARASRTPKPTLGETLAALTVEGAIRHDLEKIAERDPELATSGLAANALQLAREMDSKNSATSKSMCARALNETMEKLRELAPPEEVADAVDDLTARRQRRRDKAAAG